MTIAIEIGDPREERAQTLLRAHHALMTSLFPAESNHYLSADALCVPEITFLVAREGEQLFGCAALAHKPAFSEVKSMFVADAARGKGVADKLLLGLIATAKAKEIERIFLETGDTLYAAHKLYEKHGFTYCGPFGDYAEDPNSLFMERAI
jgi:putative acetyltransferase